MQAADFKALLAQRQLLLPVKEQKTLRAIFQWLCGKDHRRIDA